MVHLSPHTKKLLAFGLDFCLPVFKINFLNYFLSYEKLYHCVSKLPEANNINLGELKRKLRSIAYKYFYNFKGHKIFSIFSKLDILALKKLSTNRDIIICKPDKGRGVVVLDRSTYNVKHKQVINDPSKFTKLTESIQSVSTRIEDKINTFLRKLNNLNLITEDI